MSRDRMHTSLEFASFRTGRSRAPGLSVNMINSDVRSSDKAYDGGIVISTIMFCIVQAISQMEGYRDDRRGCRLFLHGR